jgi:hypothetical protein
MTIEEAKTFLDNLKVCVIEHPIVADWLVEIENRKTEPQTDCDTNLSVKPTGSTRSKMEQVETEPQTERHLPDYSVEAQIGRELTDCAWK